MEKEEKERIRGVGRELVLLDQHPDFTKQLDGNEIGNRNEIATNVLDGWNFKGRLRNKTQRSGSVLSCPLCTISAKCNCMAFLNLNSQKGRRSKTGKPWHSSFDDFLTTDIQHQATQVREKRERNNRLKQAGHTHNTSDEDCKCADTCECWKEGLEGITVGNEDEKCMCVKLCSCWKEGFRDPIGNHINRILITFFITRSLWNFKVLF